MDRYKEAAKELNARRKLTYNKKLRLTKEVIDIALSKSVKPVVSSSFGKDSVVLMHLVHSFDKSVPIVFTNTGVCFRETIEYKKMLVKEWDLNLFELMPEKTFWEIVKEHGYPKSARSSKNGDKREPA